MYTTIRDKKQKSCIQFRNLADGGGWMGQRPRVAIRVVSIVLRFYFETVWVVEGAIFFSGGSLFLYTRTYRAQDRIEST